MTPEAAASAVRRIITEACERDVAYRALVITTLAVTRESGCTTSPGAFLSDPASRAALVSGGGGRGAGK